MKQKLKNYKFTGTYKCGHDGKETTKGYNYQDCEAKAKKNFSDSLCPACLKEEQKKQLEILKKQANENNWAKLSGTKKQNEWAIFLRAELAKNENIHYFTKVNEKICKLFIEQWDNTKSIEEYWPEIEATTLMALNTMLETETNPQVYIHSAGYTGDKLLMLLSEYLPPTKEQAVQKELETAIEKEATLIPKNFNNILVKIEQQPEKCIEITAPWEDNLHYYLKNMYYRWQNNTWYRIINETYNGPVEERIKEITHTLLKKGYGVILYVNNFDRVKKDAIEGNYLKEQTRWISYTPETEKLIIKWLGFDDILFVKARKIKSAKWSNGSMYIDINFYNDVLEFAEENDFGVDQLATEAIEYYKYNLNRKERI